MMSLNWGFQEDLCRNAKMLRNAILARGINLMNDTDKIA